jgi:hypothetical protein
LKRIAEGVVVVAMVVVVVVVVGAVVDGSAVVVLFGLEVVVKVVGLAVVLAV